MTDLLVTGNLTVDKNATVDGSMTCRSNSFFTGFLRVGALAAVGFNVLEFAQVNQTLEVAGDTTMGGSLTVNGGNGLLVEGPVVVDDILRTNTPHGIVCGGQLQVASDASLQGKLTVSGLTTPSGGLVLGTIQVGSSDTLTASNSGQVIAIGQGASSVTTLAASLTNGTTFDFLVLPSAGDRDIKTASGSSQTITIAKADNSGVSGNTVRTRGYATIRLVKIAGNWFGQFQTGVWSALNT